MPAARHVVADFFHLVRRAGVARVRCGKDLRAAKHALEQAVEVLREAGHELADADEAIVFLELRSSFAASSAARVTPPRRDFAYDEQDSQDDDEDDGDQWLETIPKPERQV